MSVPTGAEQARAVRRQPQAGRTRRVLLAGAAAVSTGLLGLVGGLALWSRGTPAPFVDEDGTPIAGGIAEKVFVEIGGVRQGMFIRGRDAAAPVLLHLHGGLPEYFLERRYHSGLDDLFTVVWWEQRGSGLSSAGVAPGSVTAERLIVDTLELVNHLRDRFGVEKIYLMGYSGGSFIGVQAAARVPELFHAYIGVAQMADQRRSEHLAYAYMLEQFRRNGNTSMVRALEAAPVTLDAGTPDAYLRLRDPAMHRLGIGTTHAMRSIITGIFVPSWLNREYTLREKVNLWRAKIGAGASILWDEMLATDLAERVPRLAIPTYFFHGVHDYTCAYAVAKAYFDTLVAPVKGFYTFERSAHSPIFEEPARALRILREDVLNGTNRLADATGDRVTVG